MLKDEHFILILPLESESISNGNSFNSDGISDSLDPINRFIEKKVFSGLITAWRLAICPTNNSCFFV